MKGAKRTRTRTRSVTAKVSPEQESVLKRRAGEAGLTLSEWSRRALLDALEAPPGTRLLTTELMALRKIFLTIHIEVLQGHEMNARRLKTIVDDAEATKYAMADQRIQKFYSGESAA